METSPPPSTAHPGLHLPTTTSRKPHGYWKDPAHQRAFLEGVARDRGFALDDEQGWRQVTVSDIRAAGGRSLLCHYPSLLAALRALFPQVAWSLHQSRPAVPNGHWQCPAHRRHFLDELCQRRGHAGDPWPLREATQREIKAHGGAGLLRSYGSWLGLLQEVYPHLPWTAYTLARVPRGHWKAPAHVRAFMEGVRVAQRIERDEEWGRVSLQQIRACGGAGLLDHYENRLQRVLQVAYPDKPWAQLAPLLARREKRSSQRQLFLAVQEVFPHEEVLEEYLWEDGLRATGKALELDIWVPAHRLALEYQGAHHYHEVPSFGSLELYQQRDAEKRALCHQYGIRLLPVPYWTDLSPSSIRSLLALHSCLPDSPRPTTKKE